MKNRLALFTLLALFASSTVSATSNNHAVGLDGILLFDRGQFEPDGGMMNLFYQGKASSSTAFMLGYAWGRKATLAEASYKVYTGSYLNSTFFNIGLEYIDVDNSATYNHDYAMLLGLGYDHIPAPNLTISYGTNITLFVESPATGNKDPIFTPSIMVLYAF